MNLEHYFISQLENRYIGDDGAFIDNMVYSKDAFFENVHFKTEWLSYYEIAKKAMLVNISDAIAMNAKPKYALLSVAMPKDMSKEDMKELALGFYDTAQIYGIDIIGGDTISNVKLDITITIISTAKKPLTRRGIRDNSLLGFTGQLGASYKELQKLFRGGNISKNSKFINIVLRQDFIVKSARYLQSGMDISDGLSSDLEKLSSLNKKSFIFFAKMPKRIGCSGEEYEMLVAFDPRMKKCILRRAEQTRTKFTIFAKAKRGKYKNRCKAHHFA